MDEEESRTEAAELIRNLIDRIILTPSEQGDRVIVDLQGDLAGIRSIATSKQKTDTNKELQQFNQEQCRAMVAGPRSHREPHYVLVSV